MNLLLYNEDALIYLNSLFPLGDSIIHSLEELSTAWPQSREFWRTFHAAYLK